jgi:hypothetical protein
VTFHPKGGSVEKTRASTSKVSEPKARSLNLLAAGLFVVFAAVAYYGAEVVAFERLGMRVDGLRGGAAADLLGSVLAWEDAAGIASRARSLALNILTQKDLSDTEAIQHALDERAKASPTSSVAWQESVAYQQASGAPVENMLAAFRMSALTGSHEGYIMNQRARFGLENWSKLPEVDRRTAIRDLLATTPLPEFKADQYRYRAIILEKSQAERDEIRAAATASGLASGDLLEELG